MLLPEEEVLLPMVPKTMMMEEVPMMRGDERLSLAHDAVTMEEEALLPMVPMVTTMEEEEVLMQVPTGRDDDVGDADGARPGAAPIADRVSE